MKKLPIFLLICLLIGIVACKETEDYWTQYEQWRETNESWFIEQLGAKDEKGNPIYTKVVPSWDHSIYRTQVKQNIKGWIIALEQMKVGDSCRVIIPQTLGYGAQYMSSLILPYTTLVFDMKLVDIPGLDKPVTE